MAIALSSSALDTFSVAHQSTPPSTGRPPKMSASSSAASTLSASGKTVTNSWKNAPDYFRLTPGIAQSPAAR